MPPRKLNGYQHKLIRYALKAELKAKRDGLVTKGDEFCRGYAAMLSRAQRLKALTNQVAESIDRLYEDQRLSRDYRLGYKAAVYDLRNVFYADQKTQRTEALLHDWYARSAEKRRKNEARRQATAALYKEMTEL